MKEKIKQTERDFLEKIAFSNIRDYLDENNEVDISKIDAAVKKINPRFFRLKMLIICKLGKIIMKCLQDNAKVIIFAMEYSTVLRFRYLDWGVPGRKRVT